MLDPTYIKVAMLDDEPHNVRIIDDILEDHPQIHLEGFSTRISDFKELVPKLRPDIVLLDITLLNDYKADGIAMLKWIVREATYAKPIMLTSSMTDIEGCYQEGAKAYIVKGEWKQVIPTICNVHSGDLVLTSKIASHVANWSFGKSEKDKNDHPFTKREVVLLNKLKDGLARDVICDSMDISFFTLKRHLQNIRAKAGMKNISDILGRYGEAL